MPFGLSDCGNRTIGRLFGHQNSSTFEFQGVFERIRNRFHETFEIDFRTEDLRDMPGDLLIVDLRFEEELICCIGNEAAKRVESEDDEYGNKEVYYNLISTCDRLQIST